MGGGNHKRDQETTDADNHDEVSGNGGSRQPSPLIRVPYRVTILLWLRTTVKRFLRMLPLPPSTCPRITLKPPPLAPSAVSLPPPPPTQLSVATGLSVISPHKRHRKNYSRTTAPRGRSKVRRKNQSTSQTELLPVYPLEEHDIDNESMEGFFGVEGESELLSTTPGGESGTYFALGYEDYVEHFESGSIGVLRLERDLYVVQGWDAKKKQAKVRRRT